MVQSKKRTVVTAKKARYDGQRRVQRAYQQLWRWAKKTENKMNEQKRKE